MNAFLANRYLLLASRILLGGLFIYYAWSKITDLPAFAAAIKNYDMIPLPLVPAFATILAGVEMMAGIALITGIFRKGGIALVVAMLLMFVIAIGTAYLRGKSIDCGCNLADISASQAADKRAHMLQRFFEDVCYFLIGLNLLHQELQAMIPSRTTSDTPEG